MSSVLILIPPSEGKNPIGDGKPLGKLDKNVQVIYDRLTDYQGDHAQLYGVKGKALDAARKANQNILISPTLPAIERYGGVVYDGIDYPTLSAKAREFLQAHVRIVSALFGLITPDQPIPEYKLKIERFDAAKYWRPIIAEKIKGSFVIDLLPQAHQKAVEYKQSVSVDFIISKNAKTVSAGHQGKLIKGKFIRWLCEGMVSNPEDFSGFKEDGFVFDGKNFVKRV